MSQVLSVKVGEAAIETALSRFLEQWTAEGSATPTADGYLLVANSGEQAMVTIEGDEILFQGQIGDAALSMIRSLAESFDCQLLYEGEPLAAEEGDSRWSQLGPTGKVFSVLGGIILLPIAVALLPVLLSILLVRLIYRIAIAEQRSA